MLIECEVTQQQLKEHVQEIESLKVKLWNLIVALDRIRIRNECVTEELAPLRVN